MPGTDHLVTTSGTLFDEPFADGLGDRWDTVQAPGFAADDGVAALTPTGVLIAPPARNPDSGEPMFTKQAEGFPGHLKWTVVSAQRFSTAGQAIRVSFRAGARCFGTHLHPYGAAVPDAERDFRLAAATLNVLDLATGMVFDFWLTSSVIVPYYERIRPPALPFEYEAFGQVATPVPRKANDVHDLAIVVDGDAGTARWEIDGAVVASVNEVGPSDPDWATVLHHGGTPERVGPGTFQVGMGLMTLLDAALPSGLIGLVDIGAHVQHPPRFAATGPTLFGQGASLNVQHVRVEGA